MITKKKVQVYNDVGVSSKSLFKLLAKMPQYLAVEIELISAEKLLKQGIEADLFIIGGGADLPYCRLLNGKGNAIIKTYVQHGGNYLGICAGAYYASSFVDFIGDGYEVKGSRELAFFNGTARGSLPELTTGQLYHENNDESSAWVALDSFPNELFYYHGGCCFESDASNVEVIARYQTNQKPAIVHGHCGNGQFLLSGVHFEYGEHQEMWRLVGKMM